MKLKALVLLLTLGFAPALVAAQTSPTPAPAAVNQGGPMQPMHLTPAQRKARMQAFRRFREQAGHLHRAARSQMLAALTPAHRALLARLVGQLSIAANPDPRAAAHELDAALSLKERHAVLDAQRSEMEHMRALLQRMRSQMQPQMGAMHGHMGMMHARTMHKHGSRHAADAGLVLLHGVVPRQPPMMMFRMMHPR